MKKIYLGKTRSGKTTKVLEALNDMKVSDTSKVLLLIGNGEEEEYKEVVPEGSIYFANSPLDELFISLKNGDTDKRGFETLVIDTRLDKRIITSFVGLDMFRNILVTAQVKEDIEDAVGVLMNKNGAFIVEVL